MDEIHYSKDSSQIATLTVNRPQVHNALDWDAMRDFARVVSEARRDKELRALIITGAGESFVSGGDLKALQDYTHRRDGLRLSSIMSKALAQLKGLLVPTIAAINGPARGGGAEIAVACDLRVMAVNADIGFVHARLGITTAWGGARYLLQLVGYAQALELLTTGRVLKPKEAQSIGLVERVVGRDGALRAARELAGNMAEHPLDAVRAAKRLLRLGIAYPEVSRYAERQIFASLWDSDFRRSMVARFLNKKK